MCSVFVFFYFTFYSVVNLFEINSGTIRDVMAAPGCSCSKRGSALQELQCDVLPIVLSLSHFSSGTEAAASSLFSLSFTSTVSKGYLTSNGAAH